MYHIIEPKNILLVKNPDSDMKDLSNILLETELVVIEIDQLSEAIAHRWDSRFQNLDLMLLELDYN